MHKTTHKTCLLPSPSTWTLLQHSSSVNLYIHRFVQRSLACASSFLRLFCLLQALALTTFSCSSGRHRCWTARRPTVSSICCCGHQRPPFDELRLPQGIESLLASKPVDTKCAVLKIPTAGTNSWKRSHRRETAALVGPMFTPKELHYRSGTTLGIPVTVSGIHSHSKTSN